MLLRAPLCNNLSYDEQTERVKTIPEDDRPATSEPAWVIPTSHVPDAENNWANALATTYQAPAENSLLAKTGDMRTFMNWYCQKMGKTELTQAYLEGQGYEVVKPFYPDVVHLQFQMEECHKMLTDQIDWANPEGDQVRIDISKPLPLSGPPVPLMVSLIGGLIIRNSTLTNTQLNQAARADHQEYTIAEKEFKNLYPNDFEDLNLLLLQGHLNHLPGSDIRILSTAVKLWTRNLVIRHFEFKHDYTIWIFSSVQLCSLSSNNERSMRFMRFYKLVMVPLDKYYGSTGIKEVRNSYMPLNGDSRPEGSFGIWNALLVDGFAILTTDFFREQNDLFIPFIRRVIIRVLRIILVVLPEHPSDTYVFTMKMEILLEPTSSKLMVGKLGDSDVHTLEDLTLIMEILSRRFFLRLNLPDHSIKVKGTSRTMNNQAFTIKKGMSMPVQMTQTQDGERPQVNDQRLELADDLKEAQDHISHSITCHKTKITTSKYKILRYRLGVWLQKIVSRLAILGVVITQEDLNSKFLRSLPPEWNTHVVVWMNKADIETMSIDDFTSSTNDVNTANPAYEVSTVSPNINTACPQVSTANFSDNTVYAFMVENPNGSNLLQQDLEQIHEDDLEAMDLKWQLSLLSMREKRECRAPRNKEGQFKYQDNTRKQGNNEDTSSKAMLAIDGVGFDWSDMAEEQVQKNMALMAFLDSEVYNDKTCAKTCLKNYETLKKQCDDLTIKLNQTEFTAATYKRGLATVEEQLITYRKNEVLFSEEVAVLKREVACKDYEKMYLKIADKSKKGLGHNVVPPPYPLIYNRPKKLDLSYSCLDEFKDPKFKSYGSEDNKQESNIVCDKKSDASKENSDDSLVKEQVSKDTSSFVESSLNVDEETVFLVDKKGSLFHPNAQRNMVPRAVLMKTGLKPFNTARTVNTAHPKSIGKPQQDDTGFIDSGCSRHMTGNIAYLSDFKEFNGGYVTFGGGAHGGRISSKGTLKTDSLDFKDVYFVNELNFNLFSVSQMCDKKNYVLFTDIECLVLSPNFKLPDESQILLKIPRKDNMYSFDMKNIVPKESLTCLVAKATSDESMLWHRRLGHINFKNINKLVKDNLVRGLPTKHFENDQTCVACLKGKQHRASCKSKVLNLITKPLFMLYMDLFGPTFVSSLMHKKYCLVVTDDYSRFTWVFFLTTKDETSEILKNFIKEIENLVDKKVKIIRSDNGTEFKNKVMDDFCREKDIKREYSIAMTPQQNGVTERRNRTLIEAARTMLVDSKLPTTFWAEAVSTACYVQNRVLVVKPHNKTPYELFRGLKPALSFMRPFGCHVTILNTLDNLGKFDGKSNEGVFVGYSLSSKAFRVYNTRTKRVEENLHIRFLENKPMIEGNGLKWLFDIDSLTQSMNYVPVAAGTISNESAGTQGELNAGTSTQKEEISQDCIVMPIWKDASYFDSPSKDVGNGEPKSAAGDQKQVEDGPYNKSDEKDKSEDDSSPKEVNAARQHVNTASPEVNTGRFKLNTVDPSMNTASSYELDSPKDMFKLGASHTLETTHVEFFSDEDEPKVNLRNITNSYIVPTTPNTRIHKDHPIKNVIGDVKSSIQTRRMTKSTFEQGLNPQALLKPYLINLGWKQCRKNFSNSSSNRNKARLVAQGHRQEEGIDYEEVFAPMARIRAIRLLLAYASFMGFLVYQIDVKSAFLYGTIEEEVYVTQPPGFKDPDHPDKVYKANGFLKREYRSEIVIKKQKGDILLVHVYVDDIIFGSTNKELCTAFEKLMKDKFQMSSMGELTFFLGLQVTQKEDGIFISQDKYVAEILKKFNYTDVKSASTPVDLEKHLEELLQFKLQQVWKLVDLPNGKRAIRTKWLLILIVTMLEQLKIGSLQLEVVSFWEIDLLTKGFDAGRHVKRGRDTKIPRSSGPPVKVGDEAVYKELGDRMERAATTASSLEAEQDSGYINRTQSMATLNELTSLRIHLKLGARDKLEWKDFDGLMKPFSINIMWNSIRPRSTKVSCPSIDSIFLDIAPFAKRKSSRSIIAKLVVAVSSYFIWQERSNRMFKKLKRSQDQVVDCILNAVRLKLMSCKWKKSKVVLDVASLWNLVADEAAFTSVDVDAGGAATTDIGLEAGQGSGTMHKTPTRPHDSPLLRVHTLGSDEGSLQQNKLMDLVTKLTDRVEVLENDIQQTKKVYSFTLTKLILRVKKLEKKVKTNKARRRARIVILEDEDVKEDSSKQGRKISEIDKDPTISLVQPEQNMEYDFDVSNAEGFTTASVPVTTVGIDISTAKISVSTASVTSKLVLLLKI
ncbi:putative ribonuclease H-like domain-containing protein [Tanacetum coccineum]